MKNVAKIIPCYAADTSGVCSALYELSGLTVVHDASGCNSTYSTHDEPRWYDMRSNIYISALTEIDAVMGNDEKFISDVTAAAIDRKPEFIAICGSPMPMMTGFDYDSAASEIESRTGIKTFPIYTNGTRSYIDGASDSFLNIVRLFAKPNVKKANSVNVLGLTPLDFPLGSDVRIREWLLDNGMECACTLAMGSGLEDVSNMTSASVSLVVSYSGLAAAQYLYKEYAVPYVCGVPVGGFADKLTEALKSAAESGECNISPFDRQQKENDTIIIGESIMSMSIASAIGGADVISPLPCDERMLMLCDSTDYAEEDIEELLKDKAPLKVIADPLYKYIVPKGGKLIEIPHFAFSGRCFQKDMKNIITTGLGEYFK
ncbi:MAG: oxalate:formate antiporter [Ruminococcus sp.]|nr:oxalate:formate antiporter [Ruminococcus sp.]